MQKVVGIRFKKAGKIYYFDPDIWELQVGDHAIVETARGVEYGEVVVGERFVEENEIVSPLKKVLRKATEEDTEKVASNRSKQEEAFEICAKKIEEHGLPMKLVDVEYTFDNNKIIFYFTADGRIDFRELVKDLAAIFRTRIELRQIGVRDEAKMIGGIGCCGRELCCHTHLGDFAPVSIKMAKEQNLSLNPTKISGICGRLMCCLKYENDTYKCIKSCAPKVNSILATPQGDARVTAILVPKDMVQVLYLSENRLAEIPLSEAKKLPKKFDPKDQPKVEDDLDLDDDLDFIPDEEM